MLWLVVFIGEMSYSILLLGWEGDIEKLVDRMDWGIESGKED